MKNLVVLTGAGMSAESGIKTFRDADGLWEGHRVEDVATPEAWIKDQELVLDFYNQRRKQLFEVKPNLGHTTLAELESQFNVHVVTQNVDDLHERAGSSKVLHLHGELRKVRSVVNEKLVYDWEKDLKPGDLCEEGNQLRPHIVWFGEAVPMIEPAAAICSMADTLLIVGTSLLVYPAAGLSQFAPEHCEIIYLDPYPKSNYELQQRKNLRIIEDTAAQGLPKLAKEWA